MSNVDTLKIKKLLQEKKFSEVIFEIESLTSEKNRSPALHNLLGVCRVSQKGRSDRDVKYAFNDFETAFKKDDLGQISLDSLCRLLRDNRFKIIQLDFPFFETKYFNKNLLLNIYNDYKKDCKGVSPPFYGNFITVLAKKI